MLTNDTLPSGFTVRATSMDDLKDVYAIISACDKELRTGEELSTQSLNI